MRLRTRSLIETALATASAALFALTLVFPEWIEATTGLDPDGGSGALEFAIAAALLLVAVGSALLARRGHRQLALERG
ncbi:MAG: ABC transporter permease [Actinomycetota bacterium]|nr:ABC transporter permease [Actinomycetota bacterium]